MNEFRLKLDLSKFFDDVRVSSFIFVSSEIKTISDLQTHISNVFKISEELVLLCKNHFLPNVETVRILKEDEIITVIADGVRRVKKVKKRKVKEDDDLNELAELDLTFGESETQNKLKKKKKQLNEKRGDTEALEEKKPEFDFSSTIKNKNDGLIKLPELQKSFMGTWNKQQEKKQHNETVEEKKHAFSVKNSIVSHRKMVQPMSISTVAKVIKSVKVSDDKGWHFVPDPQQSISFIRDKNEIPKKNTVLVEETPAIVQDAKFLQKEVEKLPTDTLLEEEDEKMDCSDTELLMTVEEVKQKTEGKKITIHSNEKLISNPECATTSQDGSDLESKTENDSLNDTNSSIITKSKRKRIRKRKSKSKTSEIKVPPLPIPVFKTNLTIKNVHIKFDDDLNLEVISEPSEPVPQEVAVSSCKKVEEVSVPYQEVVETLNDELTEIIDPVINEKNSLVVNAAVCRKEILSYPIMECQPKVKDIIAFKKYVLSENYTPEISDFVIAQVYDFDMPNQELILNILEGAEQCADPNGKFSIDDPREQPEDVNRIEIMWRDMIEPRLIYP